MFHGLFVDIIYPGTSQNLRSVLLFDNILRRVDGRYYRTATAEKDRTVSDKVTPPNHVIFIFIQIICQPESGVNLKEYKLKTQKHNHKTKA